MFSSDLIEVPTVDGICNAVGYVILRRTRIDITSNRFTNYGVALIVSLLIGPPQGLARDAESSSSGPLRLTVAPHISSRIAMKTLPKATCVLHVDGDSDTSRSFKLFSDDDGMIRFNVNPSEESEEVAA